MSGVASLDMTLEDLIKSNKKSGGGGNFRGRGRASSGLGPARRFPNRGTNRASPYDAKAPESPWKHVLFNADRATTYAGRTGGQSSSLETGMKLYVSNLEYGVSNEDIKELFSEVGDLKRYLIHYDRSGRSKLSSHDDKMLYQLFKKYNNVQLDGKPMKIQIVGTNNVTPALPPSANGSFGNLNGIPRRQGRGGALGRIRGGVNGGLGFGGSRGRGRGRGEETSAVDLDADLEKYHSEAMQIN